MPKKSQEIESLSYEDAFRELESLVKKLEGDELALDESLALFERAQALAARCGKLLEAAELKVKQITVSGELVHFEADE